MDLSDEDSEGRPESSSEEEDIGLTAQQTRIKEIEGDLSRDPSSVPAWLALVRHSLETVPLTSQNSTWARADIAIAILKRAMNSHPSIASSVTLRIAYLSYREDLGDLSALDADWNAALRDLRSPEIAIEWLNWRLRSGKEQGLPGFFRDAEKCLNMFSDDSSRVLGLWRIALALVDAGHRERATALMQAQCELTFNIPSKFEALTFQQRLDALEAFWDSEAPRVGEPSAKGWKNTDLTALNEPHVSTEAQELSISLEFDPYTRWLSDERLAERTFPTRSTDPEDASDPYGTVLFSDIRGLLVNVTQIDALKTLRLVWLSVLGLPIFGLGEHLQRNAGYASPFENEWARTDLASPAFVNGLFPNNDSLAKVEWESHSGIVVGAQLPDRSGFGIVKNWPFGHIEPLEAMEVGHERHIKYWDALETTTCDVSPIRNLFKQLRQHWDEDGDWDQFALSFEASLSVKSALKASRGLLSEHRNSLPHWRAHAYLERVRGKTDDARKVYEAALSGTTLQQAGAIEMWRCYAEMEWLSGRSDSALMCLCRAANVNVGAQVAPVHILKAKQRMEVELSNDMPHEVRAIWVYMRALLELLTSGLEAALDLIDGHLNTNFELGSPPHEKLVVASVMLVYHFSITLKNVCPRAILRQRSSDGIISYPSNTILLGCFLESEKGEGVWGRVRHLIGEDTLVKSRRLHNQVQSDAPEGPLREKSVVRRVWEIWVMTRWIGGGRFAVEIERIRTSLSTALKTSSMRRSAIIWRIFIEFEIRAGDLKRAKSLVVQGVTEHPLCKELYLFAFGALRTVFTTTELDSLAELMADRGIRMRKDLETYLRGWKGQDVQRFPQENNTDDLY
ncbi:hypothetical protein SISNIDRAFT_330589 [Sistotremastrum niveocremeum HHB9708]|nr:hypothetical protein SISNIDRAFT_330589 [Sistotremastrum niveocremeum HHB9708]